MTNREIRRVHAMLGELDKYPSSLFPTLQKDIVALRAKLESVVLDINNKEKIDLVAKHKFNTEKKDKEKLKHDRMLYQADVSDYLSIKNKVIVLTKSEEELSKLLYLFSIVAGIDDFPVLPGDDSI